MTLAQQLDQLVDAIEQQGLTVRHTISPGLDAATIVRRWDAFQVAPPADLVALYQWGNGQWENWITATDSIPLFDEHYFLSLMRPW